MFTKRPQPSAGMKPIIIQGAMPSECGKLIELCQAKEMKKSSLGFEFFLGNIDGYPVIISTTLKSVIEASSATTEAILRFEPAAIINQGTAGGHDEKLHPGDIVVGGEVIIGALKTAAKKEGEGSNLLDAKHMDYLRTKESVGENKDAMSKPLSFSSDETLMQMALSPSLIDNYQKKYHKEVVKGVIYTSLTWNCELDLIKSLHDNFKTSGEELEAAAVGEIAKKADIPFLSVRVISNNIVNGDRYNISTADNCQYYVYDVAKSYVKKLRQEAEPEMSSCFASKP